VGLCRRESEARNLRRFRVRSPELFLKGPHRTEAGGHWTRSRRLYVFLLVPDLILTCIGSKASGKVRAIRTRGFGRST